MSKNGLMSMNLILRIVDGSREIDRAIVGISGCSIPSMASSRSAGMSVTISCGNSSWKKRAERRRDVI
jgi:hypothetical protein